MLTCSCGKEYKHVQSFRRHQKVCPGFLKRESPNRPTTAVECQEEGGDCGLRDIIKGLVKQNQEMMQANQKMQEAVTAMLPRIGSNNTTFNIGVFLDSRCANAVNLSDFVAGLRVNQADLEETRQLGFATGLANIFLRGLRGMELHRRPIHCCNLAREELYVRDNNAWDKEGAQTQLRAAISTVAKRQTEQIKEWEKAHPGWCSTEEGARQYLQMIRCLTETEPGTSEPRIIRTIAKEVVVGEGDVPSTPPLS
tara:strand:- start:8155 stop:8913 length:759 start_codon:yes stop_codon:yes gene_type:complete